MHCELVNYDSYVNNLEKAENRINYLLKDGYKVVACAAAGSEYHRQFIWTMVKEENGDINNG